MPSMGDTPPVGSRVSWTLLRGRGYIGPSPDEGDARQSAFRVRSRYGISPLSAKNDDNGGDRYDTLQPKRRPGVDFPAFVSLTLTNACNLRCRMCAQWSATGYVREQRLHKKSPMELEDWMRVVDEAGRHGLGSILIRGGEPFLYPRIVELLDHICASGLFVAIDSNGTRLSEFADELVRMRRVHVTISVDGPAEIHDNTRGVDGCFRQISEGISALKAAERRAGHRISKSITFTIGPWSYQGLGAMPDVARSLGIETLCIVPNFYVTEAIGLAHERAMRDALDSTAFSWRGACQSVPRVEIQPLLEQLRTYKAGLGSILDYPYLPLSEDEYRAWFSDVETPVSTTGCLNVERLIDIQPAGDANFCVDYPDYCIGNVKESSISELWNSERAERFRQLRRQGPFPACHRCVAKYMAVERPT
jgi:MoaA/NifB/PqqE/SkfB family radical SAM enzyme